MQIKAGYIVDSIAKIIKDEKAKLDKHNPTDIIKLDQINGLLQYVSSFDVEFPYPYNEPDFRNLNPVLATLNNIITRGLPTKAPILIENKFKEIGLVLQDEDNSEISYSIPTKGIEYQIVFELLHILEPGLEIFESNYAGQTGSKEEWLFLHEMLKDYPFAKQILQSQRSFATINRILGAGRSVDYSYEFPYLNAQDPELKKKGIIFEYDGQHHQYNSYKYYDTYRDKVAEEEGFDTLRQSSDKLELDQSIINQFKNDIYKIFGENFKRNIKSNLEEYSLIFIPIAVARIQKTIIEYFLVHSELFNNETIKIAIIERDVPCGALAIESLRQLFDNINGLLEEGDQKKLPFIELSIYQTEKWVYNSELHLNASIEDESHFEKSKFDIIIDHSVLRRSNIYKETKFLNTNAIKIRSSHYYDTSFGNSRRVYCADLLQYKNLVRKKDDGSFESVKKYEKNINFFIQNIYRKIRFRDGQLPIISRALQQKPVIGLLPTGAGKSITYQLPVFLQPGLCLVVDPIKSLMEDQVRVLKQNWIDCCDYINSNLERTEKAKRFINFRYGETMFLFVSPERLVMNEFRSIIKTIDNSDFGLAFSYGIIDEVHCVSEWGHDFRTTYLMLGKNIQTYTKTRANNKINLIGLTATASFDVLTDIERELDIPQESASDAIISIDNTIRPELIFNVIENHEKPTVFPINDQKLKDFIGEKKQILLNFYIQNVLEKFDSIIEQDLEVLLNQHVVEFEINDKLTISNEDDNLKVRMKNEILAQKDFDSFENVPTVIFCPHTKGSFGVTQEANNHPARKEVYENLEIDVTKKGFFIGGDDTVNKKVTKKAQQYFVDFMEDKINYMVCTKAFGMGIDKDNIRSVFHLNLPSSPESYIQEAGRAGRDKAKAICTIVYDRNKYCTVSDEFIKNYPTPFATLSIRKIVRDVCEDYDNFQNRIFTKFYKNEDTIKSKFSTVGIALKQTDIKDFNQDFEVNDYFRTNSFKGIKTENYQIERFFQYNEGTNTTLLKLLQDKYNLEYDDDLNFNLHLDGGLSGYLYINNSNKNAIGRIKTNSINPITNTNGLGENPEPDIEKTNEILSFLIEGCKEYNTKNHTGIVLYDFLSLIVIEGLNDGKSLMEFFKNVKANSTFEFKVPNNFNNNELASKIEMEFSLIRLNIIHNNKTTIDFLDTLKNKSFDFKDFIMRIEEQWNINLFGTTTFEEKRGEYEKAYYSEIGMLDVQRIIYRLYSIRFVQDYTIDYNLGIISITFLKKEKRYYVEQTEKHLLKYLSRSSVKKIIDEINKNTEGKIDEFDSIKECVKHILYVTYEDVVAKRKRATEDLNEFIVASIDKKKHIENQNYTPSFENFWFNYYFKEELYYYFNAKYARVGFMIGGKPFSLTDDTERGRKSNWQTVSKFIELLNDQSSFIAECKMIRGSCKRIWRTLGEDTKNEYSLKILYAYATLGLNNSYYYEEAESYLLQGFRIFYNTEKDYSEINKRFDEFEDSIIKSSNNQSFKSYLKIIKYKILIDINLEFANTITTNN